MAGYADEESRRAGLGISVTSVLPGLTPATELGRLGVAGYAARAGVSEEEFMRPRGTPVTPASAGQAFVELAACEPSGLASAYTLSGVGLEPL
jgi:3-oxoacyl-[acyl-carrier protein] reductase